MKKGLLIITQKVDQDEQVLGFFVAWIAGFAKHYDRVIVGCLNIGRYDLPPNVSVIGLGKDRGFSKLRQLWNFYRLIMSARRQYDDVFVHMTPIWVILGGWLWRLLGKQVSLWYAHGTVNTKLRIAEKLTHLIFTSTKEGCRIQSPKIHVVGQGIDTDYFRPTISNGIGPVLKIVTIGRISPSKDYETLIKAVAALSPDMRVSVRIIGGAAKPEDKGYVLGLTSLIEEHNLTEIITFQGPVPNRDILSILQSADLFVNMGQTGSLDKAILEAMAVGVPVLTCNEALVAILGAYADKLMYPKKDFRTLAEKITMISNMTADERTMLASGLRDIVVRQHNLHDLIQRITNMLHHHGAS